MSKEYHIETKCIQSGWKPKKGEPRMMPIYQSTTFKYDTTEEMGRLFDLKDNGYFYTRCQNPTNDLVASKIADLEGGVAAVLTSSGQAANFYAVFNICEAGDHVICASAIYGGTLNVLGVTAKKMGIECTFIDVDAPKEELDKDKFPGLTQPDESYHGVVYTKQFGKAAYITKINAQLMRDLGSIPSPMNSFILNLGLESLVLRVERHCYNAQKVAEYLEAHPLVGKVNYPGLPGDKYYDLAQKYMPKGTCGVISFELKAGREAAVKFMDSLKLASIVTHVADAKTSVLHPASHTHRQLNDEQLVAAGVSPGMIRLSVGIEHVDDIIGDLEQALAASEK